MVTVWVMGFTFLSRPFKVKTKGYFESPLYALRSNPGICDSKLGALIQPKVHHSGGFGCFLVPALYCILAHIRIKSGFKLGPDSREK